MRKTLLRITIVVLAVSSPASAVSSGTITATYSYNSDRTGSYTPSTGESIDFVLTGVDTGSTLSEGSNVSYGFFSPEVSPFGPFNPHGLASNTFYAGTLDLGTSSATTTAALATVTQSPTGSNTGTFSGNVAFWNSATNQSSGTFTGNHTTDTLTTRVTGTTNISGAASFAIYQLNTNQFVLVGTTSGDTEAVLIIFQSDHAGIAAAVPPFGRDGRPPSQLGPFSCLS